MRLVPDILNCAPRAPDNLAELREKLQFAFSSSESNGALLALLPRCDVSLSEWQPDCFADGLFIDALIKRSFRIERTRFSDDFHPPQSLLYLKRVLLSPPADPDSISFRARILEELQREPALRVELEVIYRDLCELRADLDAPDVMGAAYSTRRRIDLLLRIKRSIDKAADAFAGARSGLARVRDWAREFQASAGYAALRNFADHESRLSSVQLQFQVGLDGSVRNLTILKLDDNHANPLYQSAPMRLWNALRLWLRGSKASRGALVARLVQTVFDGIEADLAHVLYLIGHLEFYLGALAFADRCHAKGLSTCFPRFVPVEQPRAVRGLFNPLLLGLPRAPVVCEIEVARSASTTLVTGPNSGGKTRLLQSLGLVQLLGQGGLLVPAAEAELWFRRGMFVSLIQDTRADQTEGRLGTELLRIRRLFEKTPREALIILDELCSGTNPCEGEEIILMVLSTLAELAPEAFISTHFLRFTQQLREERDDLGLNFLQVDLDAREQVTYQFTPGVARTSLAAKTAQRLGVTREQILALIEDQTIPEPTQAALGPEPRAEPIIGTAPPRLRGLRRIEARRQSRL